MGGIVSAGCNVETGELLSFPNRANASRLVFRVSSKYTSYPFSLVFLFPAGHKVSVLDCHLRPGRRRPGRRPGRVLVVVLVVVHQVGTRVRLRPLRPSARARPGGRPAPGGPLVGSWWPARLPPGS